MMSGMSAGFDAAVTTAGGETRIAVRLVPRASVDAIAGVQDGAVRLRVNAPPVDGKANAAALRFLAVVLGLRVGDLRIVSGARSRSKVIGVTGLDPGTVARRLASG